MALKIVPKTLAGILHNLNKGACDWGWQGLVAYGCQNTVVVLDPATVQVIQTLDRHKGYVVKVRWARENYHHDLGSPYTLRLASADHNGHIIIWDVTQASVRTEFSEGSKPIGEMEWLMNQDASHDLLAVLHPPSTLILWNADTGTKLWKKSYTDTLLSFAFDPFDPARLAFLGQDCIVFVEDFSVSKMPSSNGKKYYISSPTSHSSSSISHSTSSDKISGDKKSKQTLTRRVTNILVGESSKRSGDDAAALNECLQLTYHRACRHHLILLYPREILILDLNINQTVGVQPMDRTGSPFTQVISHRQRDVLMCLHENGSVTVRVRRRQAREKDFVGTPGGDHTTDDPGSSGPPALLDVSYDLRCQSDPLRVTKNTRVYGLTACPVSESKVGLVMSDGRVLLWELKTIDHQNPVPTLLGQSPLYTPGCSLPHCFTLGGTPISPATLTPGDPPPVPPKMALCELFGQTQTFVTENQLLQNKHGVLLKFVLMGLLSGVAAPPLVLRMCPPLTTKNWAMYQPLLALGTATGLIQVYNLCSGQLTKEFSVHCSTVRGIEWVSLQSFLSYSYPSPGTNSAVKNEVVLTNIQTGKTTQFRPHRDDESPIDLIKISHLKQYFVIVFKDKPFELWDLRSGALLRQMPKNFPHVTALEWSPSHNLKSLKKRMTVEVPTTSPSSSAGTSSTTNSLSQSYGDLSTSTSAAATATGTAELTSRVDSKQLLQSLSVREHFVFTDSDGLLYHFIVEGNMIKDGSKIPPDGAMGSITSIAWKAETLVLGDVDGNLNLWDLKARVSRAVPTHRGWVKKIKFAPGRGNMKLLVLFNDGAEVWDAKDVQKLSAVKCPREIAKVTDCDWAASDRPVLACADGCVRVTELDFTHAGAPLEDTLLTDPVLRPHLSPPRAALQFRCILQHQPWATKYGLSLEETDSNADISRHINEQLGLLSPDMSEYLPRAQFGTAERCLITARLFGDESEILFWTVALHYLRAERASPSSKKIPRSSSSTGGSDDLFIPTTPAKESHDLVDIGGIGAENMWGFIQDRPLETCFDVLCDNHTFQKYQLDRTSIHDSKRATHEHTCKCAENLMLLGETDRAVQLLLETEADTESYYVDSLRACLVASIRSSGASQSTIKLVATNLIANGKLSEGVQLLCLIDKGLDACRYLQTYNQWHQAAWLAKATLDYTECCEVMRRWADHLGTPQVNQKSLALLVLVSLGQFVRVIEELHALRYFDRATLFIEACQEFGLLELTAETETLIHGVFLEYARFLMNIGHQKACQYYCERAGDRGEQLLKDINTALHK